MRIPAVGGSTIAVACGFVIVGCGPIDPVMNWEVYEAAVGNGSTVRIETARVGPLQQSGEYLHPRIVFREPSGSSLVLDLYSNDPKDYCLTRKDQHGNESQLELCCVYRGSRAPANGASNLNHEAHRSQSDHRQDDP